MHNDIKEIVNTYLGKSCKDSAEINRISKHIEKKFKSEKDHNFTFIDLFAGIGGMRLGFESEGGKCVFSSEWDENAQKTYFCNFGEIPDGDITKIDEKSIPDHDVLLAGFPCQAFSIAGERKGFEDTRGTLFFDVARIIKHKQPSSFLLENVKGLLSHDKGNTFSVICATLDQLGYDIHTQVLNTKDYGNTPQTRERVYIVGFNRKKVKSINFSFPEKIKLTKTIHSCLENEKQPEIYYYKKFDIYPLLKKSMKKTDTVYQWRRVYVRENKSNVCPTLTANMGTGGHNVPLVKDSYDIRKLTPRECARFQGFPETYLIPNFMARSHLYKQFGNSVSVTVISRIAESIHKVLNANKVVKVKGNFNQARLPLENVL